MKFKLKDPGSAITHGIAFLLAAVGAAPLLIRSSEWSDHIHIVALGVFILTMMLLYAASTLYHSVDSTAKVNRRLKKLDHMMIFVMIAGSYTPVALSAIRPLYPELGIGLAIGEWALTALAVTLTAIDLRKYRVFSMVCYIGMGWAVLPFAPQAMEAMGQTGFTLLLAGGIAYTLGSILYGIGAKRKWLHSVFHIFVVLGSVLHFFAIFLYAL